MCIFDFWFIWASKNDFCNRYDCLDKQWDFNASMWFTYGLPLYYRMYVIRSFLYLTQGESKANDLILGLFTLNCSIQGVLAIRGLVFRGFVSRGFLKPQKCQHFAKKSSFLEMKMLKSGYLLYRNGQMIDNQDCKMKSIQFQGSFRPICRGP